MKLFLNALEREVVELHRRGVRVRFIGERERFGAQIRERMQAAEAQTAGNERLALNIAASYGGRQDIRSEEHTSELKSLMSISYAVFCLTKKHNHKKNKLQLTY